MMLLLYSRNTQASGKPVRKDNHTCSEIHNCSNSFELAQAGQCMSAATENDFRCARRTC